MSVWDVMTYDVGPFLVGCLIFLAAGYLIYSIMDLALKHMDTD